MVLKSLSLSCTESTAAARPTLIAPPKKYIKKQTVGLEASTEVQEKSPGSIQVWMPPQTGCTVISEFVESKSALTPSRLQINFSRERTCWSYNIPFTGQLCYVEDRSQESDCIITEKKKQLHVINGCNMFCRLSLVGMLQNLCVPCISRSSAQLHQTCSPPVRKESVAKPPGCSKPGLCWQWPPANKR